MPLYVWLVLGLIVICILATYAGLLWRRVWRRQQLSLKIQQAQAQRLKQDLIIIAQSFQTQQVPSIEGAIRLKVLLDNFDPLLSQQPEFQALHDIYQATAHIPTHEAWKVLPRTEKKAFEKLFTQLETEHKQALATAVQTLLLRLTKPS